MRLLDIRARAHSEGNRIDLTWRLPEPAAFPNVRLLRRTDSHPTGPDDGVLITEGADIQSARDSDLEAEATYYYGLFPYRGTPREYAVDPHNRAIATATGRYGMAEYLFGLLPLVYHRYDRALPDPATVAAEDRDKGQLRRFLDIPGGHLDQLYSATRALLRARDLQAIPGHMLPLLAQWIGWHTDGLLEFRAQRNEIAYAPHIYQRIGILPVIGATVKRISGWESRGKEFIHNVHHSNRPERLNLWVLHAAAGDAWPQTGELLSLDHAYDGRASLTVHEGVLWLFYHTVRNRRWDIWCKTRDLSAGRWGPGQRLSNSRRACKQPSVAVLSARIWLFWSSYDAADASWSLEGRVFDGTDWSDVTLPADTQSASRSPATVELGGRLWLFWQRRTAGVWRLHYAARTDAGPWSQTFAFPLQGDGSHARLDADLHATVRPQPGGAQLFLVWARKTEIAPGQDRWEIAYRVKTTAGIDSADWSNVRVLPRETAAQDRHEREPFCLIDENDELWLYRTANRGDGGYGLWRSRLVAFDVDPVNGVDTWGAPQAVAEDAYTQRAPALVLSAGERWLVYRSNAHLEHHSTVYGATLLRDGRYAGALSADTRHGRKLSLRGDFDDFQTYSYDTGRDEGDWYSRDSLGVYLENELVNEAQVEQGIERLAPVLKTFMPLTDRAVFIRRRDLFHEYVYGGGSASAAPAAVLESHGDTLNTLLSDLVLPPGTNFGDTLE